LKSQIPHGPLTHKSEADDACESTTTAKRNNGRGKDKNQKRNSDLNKGDKILIPPVSNFCKPYTGGATKK